MLAEFDRKEQSHKEKNKDSVAKNVKFGASESGFKQMGCDTNKGGWGWTWCGFIDA